MAWALLAASEATTTSKHPRRSNLTSDLKSVTPITYLSMVALTLHPRLHIIATEEGNHGPLTCVASPQVIIASLLATLFHIRRPLTDRPDADRRRARLHRLLGAAAHLQPAPGETFRAHSVQLYPTALCPACSYLQSTQLYNGSPGENEEVFRSQLIRNDRTQSLRGRADRKC